MNNTGIRRLPMNSRIRLFVSHRVNACFQDKQAILSEYMKLEVPNEADQMDLFARLNSRQQYSRDRNGRLFEQLVADILNENNLVFQRQVDIDERGIVVGYEKHNRIAKCHHRLDFVVGDVRLKTDIRQYFVLSCKTSCRERWKQDDWSLTCPPKGFYLLTLSDDYPPSEKFQESSRRRIVTLVPKKRDNRVFKETFDDIIEFLKKNTSTNMSICKTEFNTI